MNIPLLAAIQLKRIDLAVKFYLFKCRCDRRPRSCRVNLADWWNQLDTSGKCFRFKDSDRDIALLDNQKRTNMFTDTIYLETDMLAMALCLYKQIIEYLISATLIPAKTPITIIFFF